MIIFVVRALVYIWAEDTPDFFHMDHLVDAPMFPFHDYKELVIEEIGYKGLAPGWHSVWAEGWIIFNTYNGPDGPEEAVEVLIDTQKWNPATEGDMDFLAITDVAPVFFFYATTEPTWTLIGCAGPIGEEDVSHHVWRRIDDDKKFVYQFSEVGGKMPTRIDGAYFDMRKAALVKGLEVVLQPGVEA